MNGFPRLMKMSLLSLAVGLGGAGRGWATEAAPTPAPLPPPKGVRVFTCGHSFHAFVPKILEQIAKSAGITDHEQVGISAIGGSQIIQHWNVPDEKNKAKQALESGRVEVLTLSPIWMPDEGLDKFGELAVKKNPNIRIYVQEFWMPNDEYKPVYPLDSGRRIDHNATKMEDLKKAQAAYDKDLSDYVKRLNAKLGREVFFIVPVGQAVIALREAIIKGEIRGLSSQESLFFDGWGHPGQVIMVLDAYCNYVAIYHRNPAGLPNIDAETGLYAPTLRAIQEIAWKTVTAYPMSGMTAAEVAAAPAPPPAK